MLLEPNPSARVQVKTSADLLPPAICAMCGNGTCIDGYVDPQVFYDWEGQVYFCMNCAYEIVRAVGSLTPAESRYLEDLNRKMADQVKDLQEQIDALNHINDAVNRLTGLGFTPNGSGTSDLARSIAEAGSAEPTGSVEGTAKREPVAKKSTASSRSHDAAQPSVRNSGKSFSI